MGKPSRREGENALRNTGGEFDTTDTAFVSRLLKAIESARLVDLAALAQSARTLQSKDAALAIMKRIDDLAGEGSGHPMSAPEVEAVISARQLLLSMPVEETEDPTSAGGTSI